MFKFIRDLFKKFLGDKEIVYSENKIENSEQKIIGGNVKIMNTTEIGYINKNNQRNNGRTDKAGTDFGQWFYAMECLDCGCTYEANGSNIYEKRCPNCQGGRP